MLPTNARKVGPKHLSVFESKKREFVIKPYTQLLLRLVSERDHET